MSSVALKTAEELLTKVNLMYKVPCNKFIAIHDNKKLMYLFNLSSVTEILIKIWI